MPDSDQTSFGAAIKAIRLARGWKQSEVASRLETYYRDERAYRRIENNERSRPKRDAVIAILTRGLCLTDVQEIDQLLALAGYESLTVEERSASGLSLELYSPRIVASGTNEMSDDHRTRSEAAPVSGAVIVAAFVALLTLFLLAYVGSDLALPVLAAFLYAGLFVLSLFLETAYGNRPEKLRRISLFVFALVLLSSDLALLIDCWAVEQGRSFGLLLSFTILMAAAIAQWVLARSVLPDVPVVETEFQAHTAQTAHLKNTSYFLLLALFFWAPPVDAILHLRLAAISGKPFNEPLVNRLILVGHGMFSLGALPLLIVLVLMLLISIPMGSRLTENVKPGPHRNRYITLFYARAFLYFLVAVLCLGWFVSRLSDLMTYR